MVNKEKKKVSRGLEKIIYSIPHLLIIDFIIIPKTKHQFGIVVIYKINSDYYI